MRFTVIELTGILELRLQRAEEIAKQGVIPGQLDTTELEQLIGRIKELKHVISFMKEDNERLQEG